MSKTLIPQYTNHFGFVIDASWDIFVQSTSVNRKLLPGTEIIVRKS